MLEIELKAHVKDRDTLIAKLSKIATYMGHFLKDDTYWGNGKQKLRIRRQHASIPQSDGTLKECDITLLTYKRKERKECTEVNEEKETEIKDATVLEQFLKDSGFSVMLKKYKDVMDWEYPIAPHPFDKREVVFATYELCTVETLGDFLEIEILAPETATGQAYKQEIKPYGSDSVVYYKQKLAELLSLVDISPECIEHRYYSELLETDN